MRATKAIFAVLTIAVLTACGGGGDGGGQPAPVAAPFTTTNFASVATPTAAAILASSVTGDSLSVLSDSGASSNSSSLSLEPSKLATWALKSVPKNNFKSLPNGNPQAQAVTPFNEACPAGGSLSGNFNDVDNNRDLSAGDSLTISANNCVVSVGSPAINGSFSLGVSSIRFTSTGDISNASLSMRFTNFTSAGNTLNGALAVTLNGATVTTNYQNFTNARTGIATATLNFTSVITNGSSLSINGPITINNSTYTLSTPSPIILGTTYPIGGTLRAVDAAGGRIDFVSTNVSGGFLDCDLYLPGDTVRDARISSAWSAI